MVQFSSLSDNLDCVYGKRKRGKGKMTPKMKAWWFSSQTNINFDAFILGINCNFTAWTSIKVIYGIIIFLEAWRRICQLAKLQKASMLNCEHISFLFISFFFQLCINLIMVSKHSNLQQIYWTKRQLCKSFKYQNLSKSDKIIIELTLLIII